MNNPSTTATAAAVPGVTVAWCVTAAIICPGGVAPICSSGPEQAARVQHRVDRQRAALTTTAARPGGALAEREDGLPPPQ